MLAKGRPVQTFHVNSGPMWSVFHARPKAATRMSSQGARSFF